MALPLCGEMCGEMCGVGAQGLPRWFLSRQGGRLMIKMVETGVAAALLTQGNLIKVRVLGLNMDIKPLTSIVEPLTSWMLGLDMDIKPLTSTVEPLTSRVPGLDMDIKPFQYNLSPLENSTPLKCSPAPKKHRR
eukprot:1182294-Prorocentrum_minimum.AAC.2